MPKRRRSQFRLRTFLAVIAIIACGFGWNLHVIRDRQALRDSFSQREATFFEGDQGRPVPVSISIRRKFFGDPSIEWIQLPIDAFTEDEEELARAHFPEAKTDRNYGRWVP